MDGARVGAMLYVERRVEARVGFLDSESIGLADSREFVMIDAL